MAILLNLVKSFLFCLFILICQSSSMCLYVYVIFLSLTTCAIYIGGTITTIAFLFIYKYIMFNTTLIVVRHPSIYTS